MKLSKLIKQLTKFQEEHGGDVPVLINTTYYDGGVDEIGRIIYDEGDDDVIAPCINICADVWTEAKSKG
jgi:hypothetical protein